MDDEPNPSAIPDADEPDVSAASERLYTPSPDEAQLTFRAVAAGCVVGSVVSCTNIYMSLKIGFSFGASIITAVLGFAIFAAVGRRLTVLETNTSQTTGSAAGYMSTAAGLVAAVPALNMLGYEIYWPYLMLWALGVAYLGVFYAVPLRRQMVEVDKLRFPTGTATAETIMAMFSEASEAIAKARVLVGLLIAAGLYTLATHFIRPLHHPHLHEWVRIEVLATAFAWSFSLYIGPSLIGAGMIMGPRVVASMLLGAVIGWAVLGPLAQLYGWAPHEDPMDMASGARGWILWPGVAIMVAESLTTLAFSWKTFVRALRFPTAVDHAVGRDDFYIPNSWWIGGLIGGSMLTVTIAHFAFQIPWYLTLVAIALSSILSAVATRALGETDINPVGGMGKVTQLVFGALAPGQMTTNLLAAAITGGGASQAADMMQDLKTGSLLGASPRKQMLAQLAGITMGIFLCVPAYELLTNAYPLGEDELPAPAAIAWKAMAELLAKGTGALPEHTGMAVVIASLVGALIAVLRRFGSIKAYVPSGLAMGIALIIPAYYSMTIFYGLAAWWVWKAVDPKAADRYTYAAAAGLIAGEGLMGIVNAGLTVAGVNPLVK